MKAQDWLAGERDKCQACAHSFRDDDPKQDKPGTILRCGLLPWSGRGKFQFAIYAREESFCGMDARKFQERNDRNEGRSPQG